MFCDDRVNSMVKRTKALRVLNKPQYLPLTDDLVKLKEWTSNRCNELMARDEELSPGMLPNVTFLT